MEWVTLTYAPILQALEWAYRLHAWCDHCLCWHHHTNEEGHRSPHCFTENSPYKATGYVLQRLGEYVEGRRLKKDKEPQLCKACQDTAISAVLHPFVCHRCQHANVATRAAKMPLLVQPSLRFFILKRDHYRCRLCGIAARDGEHVRLEVDHITPKAKRGTNDPSNLWTLCTDCNRGKGIHLL